MRINRGNALALVGTVAAAAPARADDDLRLLLDTFASDVRTLARTGARGWDDADDDHYRRGRYDD